MRNFKVGDIVKHFKRDLVKLKGDNDLSYLYKIIGFAYDTTNECFVVVYEALYDNHNLFAREQTEFQSEVDKSKYPDAKQQYRFEVV